MTNDFCVIYYCEKIHNDITYKENTEKEVNNDQVSVSLVRGGTH